MLYAHYYAANDLPLKIGHLSFYVMKHFIGGMLIALMIPSGISAQGLFESAGQEVKNTSLPFQLNGYGRGVLYLGEYAASPASEIKSGYGEAALKINAVSGVRGRIFSELRFRSGYEFNEWINEFSVREAYADLTLGKFEFRAGKAIVAWGRADAFNPTNNLTPQNYFARSPEPDDRRIGNFLIRSRYNILSRLRLEAVWVPKYMYSAYRFDLFGMPDYVRFSESPFPEATLKNGALAARIDFLFDGFDGSLSWFNGYDPMPGIQAGEIPSSISENFFIDMYARAFRQQTLGLDFSFGLGSFGVRGEAALRDPLEEPGSRAFVPSRDLCFVLEGERVIGNFSLTGMYMGRYVFHFRDLPEDGSGQGLFGQFPDVSEIQDPSVWEMVAPMIPPILEQQLAVFNRIIFDQTAEMSHTLAMRPAYTMFQGVLGLEMFGLYTFPTGEWSLTPGLTWEVSDNLKLMVGGQYFAGPQQTRFDLIAPVFNGGYFELKYSF